jgi:hypothetical protein
VYGQTECTGRQSMVVEKVVENDLGESEASRKPMGIGAPGAIPTRDLPLRRRTLYATELREHGKIVNRES